MAIQLDTGPQVSFQLSPELKAFRQEVRALALEQFAPEAAYWDEAQEFPEENRKRLAELGYFGLLIPEACRGRGAPIIQSAVLVEELGRVCFDTSTIAQIALHRPSRAITMLGNEKRKKRLLPGVVSGDQREGWLPRSARHCYREALRERKGSARDERGLADPWACPVHTGLSPRAHGARRPRLRRRRGDDRDPP